MKKTLLIALLFVPFWGMSQSKDIDGFLGIKFGSSRAAVIAALNARGGVIDKRGSKPDVLSYDKIKLGHRVADEFYVKFVNDKAYEADFFFKPEAEGDTFKVYEDLSDGLNGVYGKGDLQQKFEDPYSNDDSESNKLVALQQTVAEYKTFWTKNNNIIVESITRDLFIRIVYQDDALTDQALEKQKAKEKSDY